MAFHLQEDLAQRRQQNLYRQTTIATTPQGPNMVMGGLPYLTFCSNDYLGLANHPVVIKAFQNAANEYGVGSGSAHLVNGHSYYHQALEEALAEHTGREKALLFSTGYMANLGVISALLNKQDAVFQDKWNHASLLDGGLLSGARFQRYLHNDLTNLETRLDKTDARRKLIVTDGVFSMDGDSANLTELSALGQKHEAWLMVDDAHGYGVLGETGAGLCEALGVNQEQVPVLMATLGKGLGTAGAFVAGSATLIEYLVNFARPYIYTTAMPAATAAATLASLELVKNGQEKRAHLAQLIQYFRAGVQSLGFSLMDSSTPIQPILVGDAQTALALSNALREQGIYVVAIRPPTVPAGTARLRITLSAQHSKEHINQLLSALEKAKGHLSLCS